MQNERFERGWKKLQEIDREQGEKVIEALKDIGSSVINVPCLTRPQSLLVKQCVVTATV